MLAAWNRAMPVGLADYAGEVSVMLTSAGFAPASA